MGIEPFTDLSKGTYWLDLYIPKYRDNLSTWSGTLSGYGLNSAYSGFFRSDPQEVYIFKFQLNTEKDTNELAIKLRNLFNFRKEETILSFEQNGWLNLLDFYAIDTYRTDP